MLHEIEAFSRAFLARYNIPWQTDKTRPWFDSRGPLGVVWHYTAGASALGAAEWLNRHVANKRASAHFVLASDNPISSRDTELWEAWRAHPRLAETWPTPILQLASLTTSTWHATWANSRTIGIEIVNRGNPHGIWHSFGREVHTALLLARAINDARPEPFLPQWLLGHYHVSFRKQDPGPCFPQAWEAIRAFTLGQRNELPTARGGAHFSAVGGQCRDVVDTAGTAVDTGLDTRLDEGTARLFLTELGYARHNGALVQFQRAADDLKPDGVLGPATWGRLLQRVRWWRTVCNEASRHARLYGSQQGNIT